MKKHFVVGAIAGIIATKLFDRFAAPVVAPYVEKGREWVKAKVEDLKAKAAKETTDNANVTE